MKAQEQSLRSKSQIWCVGISVLDRHFFTLTLRGYQAAFVFLLVHFQRQRIPMPRIARARDIPLLAAKKAQADIKALGPRTARRFQSSGM
jgi:hypothetical protein